MVTPSSVRALVALVVLSVAACGRPGPSGVPVVVAAHPAGSAAPPSSPLAIEGTVFGADGRPASGAIVGVESIPYGTTYPLPAPKIAVAGADGRYRLELGAGSYEVTATSRAGGRAFHSKVDVSANGPARADLTLGGDARVLRGTVRDRHGAPVAGAVVECARVISNDTGIVFYTLTDASGAYVVALGSGRYWVAPWSAAGTSDVVTRDVPPPMGEDAQADFVVMPPDPPGPGPAEVVAWMRDHAVRLTTVEARHGFDDMRPIGAMVGDAHIVALGEATHGTREFFQMKHRMLEYLVTEKGFTAFAIEASMPEAFDVDAYVLGGPGDATKALEGLYFWTIGTEEVLDLIEWMRAYNLDPAHTRKVHFYGFDPQFPPRAAKRALAYVRKVDPAYGAKAGAALARAADALLATDWSSELGERAALAASARELLATFDARRDAWTAKTGATAFELARQYARVVSQALDGLAVSAEPSWAGSKMRDVAMADNVDWLLARDPGQKIVLWAHNAHVDTSNVGGGMGRLLRQRHGRDMVVFGFAFTEGGFQARSYDPAAAPEPLPWKVSPNPAAVFDVTMASAGMTIAALDLRAAPDTGPVHDWLDVPHGTRKIGSLFRAAPEFIPRVAFPESYDAVLFVERTTAAHPLPDSLAQEPEPPVLKQPSNLALRAKDAGAPKDWTLRGASWGYAVTADAAAGATLRRAAAPTPYGERYGSLVQKVDATPFRGARVRFRVSAHAAVAPGDGNAAHVAVWIERQGKGRMPLAPALVTQSVTTDGWKPYESTVDVPADATTIAYGIVLAGDGRVSARDASFAAAP